MLTSLYIKNYALIENLKVDFKENLSTITGETGAGKSILLGALSLVLGKRADISLVYNKNNKCIVEANFDIRGYNLISFFEENDLDYELNTFIRREILSNGKSRAFVNDTPVNLVTLNALSAKLVDIHSQHETLQLANKSFQFQIIDALAKNNSNLLNYTENLKLYKSLTLEIEKLKLEQENARKEYDYNNFLFEELEEIDLKEGEQIYLEESIEKLSHIEEIKQNLSEIIQISEEEQIGVKDLINKISNNSRKISSYATTYEKLSERISSLSIELNDIIEEIILENEKAEFDPIELERINERLQTIYQLQKKHLVNSVEDLLVVKAKLYKQLEFVETTDDSIKLKEEKLQKIESKLESFVNKIHNKRIKAIPEFIKKLESILFHLEMKNTRLEINVEQVNQFLINGKDNLEFKISSDKGKTFELIKKSASGGEISRIMLAVKAIISEYTNLPTIIFDEIDSGVSGEVSNKIADLMVKMSSNMQVIAITHLPQVASKGDEQYKVYKEEAEDSITSNIKKLTQEERILELAEMLGGRSLSDSAIAHAKQLLN